MRQVGDKAGPNPFVRGTQRIATVRPMVGVGENGNFAGVRRPDSESGPGNPVDFVEMGTLKLINRSVHAIAHILNIGFSK